MRGAGKISGKRAGCCQGSSMIYVILLVTLLAVLSCGYLAISRYNVREALNNRKYMQAQLSAKTIHRSFCEAVSSGDSQAMNMIWSCFEEDCVRVQEEFDAMMDDEEDGEAEEEEADIEPAGTTGLAEQGQERDEDDSEENERWERYLYQALGDKEYVVRGSSASEDGDTEIDITLTALPLNASAVIHTRVVSGGYRFSMMADVVFDDRDGAVMVVKRSYRRPDMTDYGVKVYLNGNGVYRYYEGD